MVTYTIPELVPILKLKKRAIRQLLAKGYLRGQIVGRQWLVAEESVKKFLRSPETIPPDGLNSEYQRWLDNRGQR